MDRGTIRNFPPTSFRWRATRSARRAVSSLKGTGQNSSRAPSQIEDRHLRAENLSCGSRPRAFFGTPNRAHPCPRLGRTVRPLVFPQRNTARRMSSCRLWSACVESVVGRGEGTAFREMRPARGRGLSYKMPTSTCVVHAKQVTPHIGPIAERANACS